MSTFELPLFPLQTVLFPGGVLPLRVFEVRYLDLIQRCEKEGAPFGVVCLSKGSEVRLAPAVGEMESAPGETFHSVGTLAHIEYIGRPQPGLLMIRCRGGRRFRIAASHQMKHGLWIGDAEYLPDDEPVPVPQDLVPVRLSLQRLVEHMRQRGAQDDLPLQSPWHWDDCGWLANRWCDVLPVGPELKQQFLAVDNPLIRLELVGDLLSRLQIGEPGGASP